MNHFLTAWLNMWIWHLPEPDYHKMAWEHYMRSKVLPYITGC
jgi:hypothetical protein